MWFVRIIIHIEGSSHILIVAFAQVLANLLSLAGVCPFVGSLSDLMGRRYVAILGASFICLGMIVSSTANTMNIFIGEPPSRRSLFE